MDPPQAREIRTPALNQSLVLHWRAEVRRPTERKDLFFTCAGCKNAGKEKAARGSGLRAHGGLCTRVPGTCLWPGCPSAQLSNLAEAEELPWPPWTPGALGSVRPKQRPGPGVVWKLAQNCRLSCCTGLASQVLLVFGIDKPAKSQRHFSGWKGDCGGSPMNQPGDWPGRGVRVEPGLVGFWCSRMLGWTASVQS